MSTAPLYDKTTPDTDRGLTACLWQKSLEAYTADNSAFGVRIKNDFQVRQATTGTTTPAVKDGWSVADAATAGGTFSFDSVEGVGGVARLASTGTTNHYGVEAQGAACVTLPTHSTLPQGEVVAEFRFDPGTADTIFLGFSEAGDNFLTSASALPTDSSDYIGFYSTDNLATCTFVTSTDNNGGTAVSDTYTIPASLLNTSMNKLGFRVNKPGSVELSVNGTYISPSVNGISRLALPIESLVVRLSATAGNTTTAPNIDLDSVDVFVAAGA